MSRKMIGVCVAGVNNDTTTRILNKIRTLCNRKNINVLVFTGLMRKEDITGSGAEVQTIIRGESEIYNLVNYDLLDGMIIFPDTLPDFNIADSIIEKCKKNSVPFVCINNYSYGFEYEISMQNEDSLCLAVEHLITVHGLTKINFIGGIPGNKESEERLAAYKKTLEKHNLPFEVNRVGYGYFWTQAEECVKKFMEEPELPQAIVCANDSMAVITSDYIQNKGYRIPEDIIITGFDGTTDSDNYDPPITTVKPDCDGVGESAIDMLFDLMEGKSVESKNISAILDIKCSCGCFQKLPEKTKTTFNYMGDVYGERHDAFRFSKSISRMNNKFAMAEDSRELFEGLLQGLFIFNFRRIYVCLCSELENSSTYFYEEKNTDAEYGISKKMVSVLPYGQTVATGTEFDSKSLLPEDIFNEEIPCYISFSPMYYKDRFLGYAAYQTWSERLLGQLFWLWLQTASNNIGSFYIKNELENMYISDHLTGLYNRRGMQKMFNKKLVEAHNAKTGYITVFCADIDYLKQTNDSFGHEAGDNAIVQCASAIRSSLPQGSVCVRTGGDEFCMLCYTENELDAANCVDKIHEVLDTYNKNSGLLYFVQCSAGWCERPVAGDLNITDMIRIADTELYKVKAER